MNRTLLNEVCRIAEDVAKLFFDESALSVSSKSSRNYVTQVDLKVSDYLIKYLPSLIPGSQVVSEEVEQSSLVNDGYVWVIDPVDGTTNFIYSFPLYSISIGLLHNFQPILGVIYNPALKELFYASRGEGAYLNGKLIHVCEDVRMEETLVLVETNPYADRLKSRSAEMIGRVFLDCIDYRVTGSAALDICYVACGRGGVFIAECLSSWDLVGACAILLEAGGHYTNWHGETSLFSKVGSTTFIASNQKLHDIALGYTESVNS